MTTGFAIFLGFVIGLFVGVGIILWLIAVISEPDVSDLFNDDNKQ